MEALSAKLYIAKRTICAIPSVTIFDADDTENLSEEDKSKIPPVVVIDAGFSGLFGAVVDESAEPVSSSDQIRLIVLLRVMFCCTVLYCTVLFCTVLYCTVLYCIVLYCLVKVF